MSQRLSLITSSSSDRRLGVERVDELDLLVQVAAVDLDVAGLVDHLGRGVELRVDVRHRLHDLGGADQRALLAVHELAELPRRQVPAHLALVLRSPILSHHGVPKIGMISSGMPSGLSGSTSPRPVDAVDADPLPAGALVVEAEQLVATVLVVEVEHGCGRARQPPPVLARVDGVCGHADNGTTVTSGLLGCDR